MEYVESELIIENPSAVCGHCHFTSALSGQWSVEDGRLVFRCDPDPQPRRGPDLYSCCESWEIARFRKVTFNYGDQELTPDDLAALRTTRETSGG